MTKHTSESDCSMPAQLSVQPRHCSHPMVQLSVSCVPLSPPLRESRRSWL